MSKPLLCWCVLADKSQMYLRILPLRTEDRYNGVNLLSLWVLCLFAQHPLLP